MLTLFSFNVIIIKRGHDIMSYYDGTKLLSMLDSKGNPPELYLCTSNRTGGKTTYFSRLLVNKFLKKQGKFCLIYRFAYELDNCADKFFKDIQGLFFSSYEMTSKKRGGGIFYELFLNEISCGYALALNHADQIKKYSHFFSDVERMLFDEFQSENNHYCNDEIKKFLSVHTSIARGHGMQTRHVPVYMLSNPVSIINPYYVEMGISSTLQKDTKFLKGDGFVLEQGYNDSASQALKKSGVNRAFNKNKYVAYSAESKYLNDHASFVERPRGKSKYLLTLKYKDKYYSIREYSELGFLYCDNTYDETFQLKIVVTTEDHDINHIMLKNNGLLLSTLRYYFEKGCFRFKDLLCKEAVLSALSY